MLQTIPRVRFAESPEETGSLVEQLVGNTPLIRLRRVAEGISPAVHVLGKAEWFNPGGSVKDRPALNIIRRAVESGALNREKVLIDATSGNTGIGYAMIGAALGYRVKLVVPADIGSERLGILRAYGAELVFTDPDDGMDGAINEVRAMVKAEPHRYFYADQYSNPANWQAHYATTGPEIWRQTGGRITHFVAGMGTSGTMMGVGRYLRTVAPTVRLIAIQPSDARQGMEGLKHMETAIAPSIYDPSVFDEIRKIEAKEAHEMVRRLAREEGLFVGVSSGAAVAVALSVARALDRGTVVTILPDGGYKYLSQDFWTKRGASWEITPRELKTRLENGNRVVLLDVREPEEWDIAHLEGALLIPQGDLPARLNELDSSDEIVVYCRSGWRSAQAASLLRKAGFGRVKNLLGGINGWAREVDPSLPEY